MTYYTNSNQIKDLMTSLTRLEVNDLGALESLSGVSVLLFDGLISICPIQFQSTESFQESYALPITVPRARLESGDECLVVT